MFEYNEELKLKSLSIWGFETEELEIDKIKHVPMHQYKISSNEYPMLYVDNLQCCIGLYAYGNGFGFAAHVNTVVMNGDEFELDSNKNPIYFKRIDDLLKEVLQSNIAFSEPLKIGIAIGSCPLGDDNPTIKMIYNGVNSLIEKLNIIGIDTIRLENINAPEFILDTRVEKIITVKNKIK